MFTTSALFSYLVIFFYKVFVFRNSARLIFVLIHHGGKSKRVSGKFRCFYNQNMVYSADLYDFYLNSVHYNYITIVVERAQLTKIRYNLYIFIKESWPSHRVF